MTISHSELRRAANYEEISVVSFAPAEPDTVNFSITIRGIEELVELECDCRGTKTIFIFDEQGQRLPIDIEGPVFASWSSDLKKKVTELLAELAEWEASMRKPNGAWDIRLLANSDLDFDQIA